MLAVIYGHENMVRHLLEKGSTVAAKDCVSKCGNVYEWLVFSVEDYHWWLHTIQWYMHDALCSLCIVHLQNGYTALHWAAEKLRKNIIPLLLQHGADIKARDNVRIMYTLPRFCDVMVTWDVECVGEMHMSLQSCRTTRKRKRHCKVIVWQWRRFESKE